MSLALPNSVQAGGLMCATSDPVQVLVADSVQMQRQLLVAALRRRRELNVRFCSMDFADLSLAISDDQLKVALLAATPDLSWQDMGVIRRLHLMRPSLSKVLLVESYDRNLVVNAFRSGVRGIFCYTELSFRLLCKCVQRVVAGEIWANQRQIQYIAETISQVPSLRVLNSQGSNLLTGREEQVVALVAEGLSNRDIALELRLSEHTVKKYLFRIFDKLGLSTRVELVLYAVNHGDTRAAEWLPRAAPVAAPKKMGVDAHPRMPPNSLVGTLPRNTA
jgi:DNA-binding NarL/FixJ family response regulator